MNALSFLKRFGKFQWILLWLAIEYLTSIRLGWVLSGTDWVRWVQFTGYSGVSLWMLVVALLLYYAVLQDGLKWAYAVAFVIVIVGPILYSYSLPTGAPAEVENEWVSRTAAWISVLVLLSAVVKELTMKK